MISLPPEIWRTIFIKLESTKEVLNCSLVCKLWYKIIRDDPVFTRELGMKQGLSRKEKIEFLNAFQHLKVLRIRSNALTFVKSSDEDIHAAMEKIEQLIIDTSITFIPLSEKNLVDGKLPPHWKLRKYICDAKGNDFQNCHLDQVLEIAISGFNIYRPMQPSAMDLFGPNDYQAATKKLVNLKHLVIFPSAVSQRPREVEAALFASLMSPNLESVKILASFGEEWYDFAGQPCLSVRKMEIDGATLRYLKKWPESLVKKYPRVSNLVVTLDFYFGTESDYDCSLTEIDLDELHSIMEIISSLSLNLTDVELMIDSSVENWFTVCETIKERVQEYFSERVYFKMTYPCKHGELEVVKRPFENPKYYYWHEDRQKNPEPLIAENMLKQRPVVCKNNTLHFPAW